MGKRHRTLEDLGSMNTTTSLINREFWQGKRVLVTGHTGFKGSWLGLWLSELGAQITGIGLEPNTNPNLFGQLQLDKRIDHHHIADIRDVDGIREIIKASQPEVVFHLAAQPLVRRSYQDPLGTWSANVQGSLNILEGLKTLQHHCAVVMITTDKVYENKEWVYGYRENDRLGGHDPYSASKAAAELAIASWRSSFCGQKAHQTPFLAIATARAGNVIGGGDWAEDRIVPDAITALSSSQPVELRNPQATRPWQHVLEPLGGYLRLAQILSIKKDQSVTNNPICSAFNFGPKLEANRTVQQLIEECLKHWPGDWVDQSDIEAPHEAGKLHLQVEKSKHFLNWEPRWSFEQTIKRTILWYKEVKGGSEPYSECLKNIQQYISQMPISKTLSE